MSTLKTRYESVRSSFEIADIGFLALRVIALAGTVGWLLVAPVPRETVSSFLRIADSSSPTAYWATPSCFSDSTGRGTSTGSFYCSILRSSIS